MIVSLISKDKGRYFLKKV